MDTWPDEALLVEVQDGNVLAFTHLVRRYQGRLFGYVLRIIRNRQTAEEIVQDALFKVYQHIRSIDPARQFSSYLYTVAKHEAINALRRSRPTLSLEDRDVMDEELDLDEQISMMADADHLRAAVQQLEEKYRRVVTLYYFDQLSYEEIAARIGVPLNTVRTHLRRAKESLRQHLTHG